MVCTTLWWYYQFGHGRIFPKSDKKDSFLSSVPPKRRFCPFLAVNCKKLCIFTPIVSMQKPTIYTSSSQWYAKHGGGFTSFKLPRHFPKVTKKTGLAPKTPFLQITDSWVGKIVKFYPQSVLAKTEWLSFPIVVVYETWRWYYWFGRGASSFKRYKKGWISTQTHQFCWFLAVDNFYPQSFNEKYDWLSFPFVMIYKTWPWYYRFGCSASYTKSEKIKQILSLAAKHADFAILQQFSIVNYSN